MDQNICNLSIQQNLYEFIQKLLEENNISADYFFNQFEKILENNIPLNQALLEKRIHFEKTIDTWFSQNQSNLTVQNIYDFLKKIQYIVPEPDDFQIQTQNIDKELQQIAAPQLVVPSNNNRFALNALNARWGSLFDALYGSDMLSEENGCEKTKEYNPLRGKKVIEFSFKFLDDIFPLTKGNFHDIVQFKVLDNKLSITLKSNEIVELNNLDQFVAYNEVNNQIISILFKNNDLHVELKLDSQHLIGQANSAGIFDIMIESAVTIIQDLEDSVAAVDAEDKLLAYQNINGLIQGTLTSKFNRGDKTITRTLKPDKNFQGKDNKKYIVSARALMLIRNVGHLMLTPAVKYKNKDIPEGILDLIITTLICLFDIKQKGEYLNSKHRNIYIVKPKMHGPEEVNFCISLFEQVETLFDLPKNTIKIGIMDEEKRTSLNLKACIFEARERLIFINTGFLDRTGDEIHTAIHAGPVVRKNEMKSEKWLLSYEEWNVKIGLKCGLKNTAQIGKGMWALPDEMKKMYESKHQHLLAGANCAWVPSPLAATIHALHYHQISVKNIQENLLKNGLDVKLEDLLYLPLISNQNYSKEEIQNELENNCQSILGYVVRWIDQGIGCSKVPNIDNINLMEDRATLRISSQLIANWYQHNIISEDEIRKTMQKMAKIVDQQNQMDTKYQKMSINFDQSIAFQTAIDLIFQGISITNGYTEPILHQKRIEKKLQMENKPNTPS